MAVAMLRGRLRLSLLLFASLLSSMFGSSFTQTLPLMEAGDIAQSSRSCGAFSTISLNISFDSPVFTNTFIVVKGLARTSPPRRDATVIELSGVSSGSLAASSTGVAGFGEWRRGNTDDDTGIRAYVQESSQRLEFSFTIVNPADNVLIPTVQVYLASNLEIGPALALQGITDILNFRCFPASALSGVCSDFGSALSLSLEADVSLPPGTAISLSGLHQFARPNGSLALSGRDAYRLSAEPSGAPRTAMWIEPTSTLVAYVLVDPLGVSSPAFTFNFSAFTPFPPALSPSSSRWPAPLVPTVAASGPAMDIAPSSVAVHAAIDACPSPTWQNLCFVQVLYGADAEPCEALRDLRVTCDDSHRGVTALNNTGLSVVDGRMAQVWAGETTAEECTVNATNVGGGGGGGGGLVAKVPCRSKLACSTWDS